MASYLGQLPDKLALCATLTLTEWMQKVDFERLGDKQRSKKEKVQMTLSSLLSAFVLFILRFTR